MAKKCVVCGKRVRGGNVHSGPCYRKAIEMVNQHRSKKREAATNVMNWKLQQGTVVDWEWRGKGKGKKKYDPKKRRWFRIG